MATNSKILLFEIIICIIFIILFVLIGIFVYISKKKEDDASNNDLIPDSKNNDEKLTSSAGGEFGKFQGVLSVESMNSFMEFDEIVDNMIVRKNRTQYVMVLQCNGVNYDLMSQVEKMAVEEGFVQFLNTLRFPIQLYVQSRTLNLKDIISTYKERVLSINDELKKIDTKIAQAKATGNKSILEKLEFEKRRKTSVLEYGQNITEYVERLSSNKNILQQKTYVVISYYTVEIGGNTDNYSVEELNNICFSELYTRAQNIISSLGNSQVTAKILNSEELAELLFVAYNRDDSELFQINKMLDAQYDSLYSTGKDVLEKRQEKLDQEINIAAIDLTTDSILKADKKKQEEERQKENLKNEKIKEKAMNLLSQYEDQLDPRVFELATKEIEENKNENKDGNKDVQEVKTETVQNNKSPENKVTSNFATRRIVRRRKTETED
jgi:hypothetical protein